MKLKINSIYTLNNGIEIPIIGLGTWKLRRKEAYKAVIWALSRI